jgi:hypothetical protein
VNAALEELLGTLLFEGYALYPYTPGATKNATPTPFGIVYPPAYALQTPSSFDKIRMQGVALAGGDAVLAGEARFLQGAGKGHQAVPRRLDAPGRTLADLARTPHVEPFEIGGLHGRVRMAAEELGEGRWRVMLCVHNTTEVADGLDRPAALGHSLLSTHPVLTIAGGRFVSPLEAPEAESVNTFPVLATDDDDALLGAAIVLPDHPRLAPESRGDLFDGTEIEEALLLHVLALSEDEREAIAAADPAVREMVARAAAATPADVMALHGRTTLSDPAPDPAPPHAEPPGEREVEVDGVTYRLGDKAVLRLGERSDPYDRILDGRTATIERIYFDYEGKLYFGVTVDDDPGRQLMRDTGRYLFFFLGELEVCDT